MDAYPLAQGESIVRPTNRQMPRGDSSSGLDFHPKQRGIHAAELAITAPGFCRHGRCLPAHCRSNVIHAVVGLPQTPLRGATKRRCVVDEALQAPERVAGAHGKNEPTP